MKWRKKVEEKKGGNVEILTFPNKGSFFPHLFIQTFLNNQVPVKGDNQSPIISVSMCCN